MESEKGWILTENLLPDDPLIKRLILDDSEKDFKTLWFWLDTKVGDLVRVKTARSEGNQEPPTYYFLEIVSRFPVRLRLFRYNERCKKPEDGAGFRRILKFPWFRLGLGVGDYLYEHSYFPIAEISVFPKQHLERLRRIC